ncbi:LuxR C-terminal-related transcriptional regulator [Methanohalobium sp.]|uniref:response regulator transcription factor n=1 Tax=Methanohalobium sp. TaxID=2837493 RepID=UPI0025E9F866|nr:LuxR C-terminal-related transcriptional regulator [Methanohalobium sp.]
MKSKVFVKKDKKTVYFIEDHEINIHLLKQMLSQKGYEVVNLEHADELFDHIEVKKTEKKDEGIAIIPENIHGERLGEYFSHLKTTIKWLVVILNNFKTGFYISDDKKYVAYNTITKKLLNYNHKDFKHFTITDNLLQTEKPRYNKTIEQTINRDNSDFTTDLFIQQKEGDLIKCRVLGFRLNIEGESFIACYMLNEKDHNLDDKNEMALNRLIINELNQILRNITKIQNLNNYPLDGESKEDILQHLQIKEERANYADFNLSSREYEVLKFIYKGYTNQQIAEKLYISKRTAEFHRSNLLSKTNSRNTADLIRFAVQNSLITEQ